MSNVIHPAPHQHDLRPAAHRHVFHDSGTEHRERAMTGVTVITIVTMVAELLAGWWSGSLALTADGWHMGTHALAIGGAALAYRLSRRARSHDDYAFGGWKIEVLAAYTSGLLLLAVSLWLVVDGVRTLMSPHPVAYVEALVVAALGLAVNLLSAWLLARGGSAGPAERGHAPAQPAAHGHGAQAHHDDHNHAHHPGHGHQHDHNFQAAYVHVLADAFTSVLAIAALAGGAWWGWQWLDPAAALLGAFVIARWAWSVLRVSARGLVDATGHAQLRQRVRELVESDGDAELADLHVWQVGPRAWAAVVSVVADNPLSSTQYRERLEGVSELAHVTVEVHRCPHADTAVN